MADLIRWRPFHGLMKDFYNDISPFFDKERLLLNREVDFMPKMDINETDKEVAVTVDVPGMEKKDLDISVEEGVLSIKGERKNETKKEENGNTYYERQHGKFERRVRLPENVDSDKIKADYKDGVLTLKAPKTEIEKPERKKIDIK